jgi:hypothetical protein
MIEMEKIKTNNERKEELEMNKLKRNVFLINKWDIIREKVIHLFIII